MLDNLATFVTQLLIFCSVFLLACGIANRIPERTSAETDWRAEAEAREEEARFLRNILR